MLIPKPPLSLIGQAQITGSLSRSKGRDRIHLGKLQVVLKNCANFTEENSTAISSTGEIVIGPFKRGKFIENKNTSIFGKGSWLHRSLPLSPKCSTNQRQAIFNQNDFPLYERHREDEKNISIASRRRKMRFGVVWCQCRCHKSKNDGKTKHVLISSDENSTVSVCRIDSLVLLQ